MTEPKKVEQEEPLDTPEVLEAFKEITSGYDPNALDDSPDAIKAAYDAFIKDSYDPAFELEEEIIDED